MSCQPPINKVGTFDARNATVGAALVPIGIGGLGMSEPFPIPLRPSVQEGFGGLPPWAARRGPLGCDDRPSPCGRACPHDRSFPECAIASLQPKPRARAKAPVPCRTLLKSCGPTTMTAARSSAGGSESSAHCSEAEIRTTHGRQSPVEPGLGPQPRHRVLRIRGLVHKRLKLVPRNRRFPGHSERARDSRPRRRSARTSGCWGSHARTVRGRGSFPPERRCRGCSDP